MTTAPAEPDGPARIVSLIPAATEIVWALGLGGGLVGRSHECDHPAGVLSLPSCTEPKFAPDGSSYAVDERIRALLQEGLSVYRVDADRLAALRPDVIVTQDQCRVCAVELEAIEAAVAEHLGFGVEIVSLGATTLDGVWEDHRRVARALGVPGRGARLVEGLRGRLRTIAGRSAEAAHRPTVAMIEWLDPLMAAGNWIPELVERAGGRPLLGESGAHSPRLEWEALRRADPDAIVIAPCGFGIGRALEDLPALTAREGWEELAAVRRGRVFVADGHHFFNRPGPRLVESAEILREILHPELGAPEHRGSGWIPA